MVVPSALGRFAPLRDRRLELTDLAPLTKSILLFLIHSLNNSLFSPLVLQGFALLRDTKVGPLLGLYSLTDDFRIWRTLYFHLVRFFYFLYAVLLNRWYLSSFASLYTLLLFGVYLRIRC